MFEVNCTFGCGDARFAEIKFNENEFVCVKKLEDLNLIYIMNCCNGKEVYSRYGADDPVRSLSPQEYAEIIEWIKKEGVFDECGSENS